MANSLPSIDIIFKQKAYTFIERSARGNAILIIKDDTDKTFNTKEYLLESEAETDSTKYTADNLQYIKDCFLGLPSKVTVIRIDTTATITDALNVVATLNTGWIGLVSETKADYDTLVTWVKQQRNTNKKTFKGIVFTPTTAPNCEGIVDLANLKITFNDTRTEEDGYKFIPTLLGYLAGANVDKGTTYLVMSNLSKVTEPSDINSSIQAGKLVLINDEDKVRIGLGINSLTTFDSSKTEDFSDISVIEAQDLMLDDIRSTWKNNFVGKYKNLYDNQVIFLSAVNSYFEGLAKEDVLDKNFENKSSIDIEAQRAAWISVGTTEAKDWTDAQVKLATFKKKLFLAGNVKILETMNDLTFGITMQ